MTETTKKIRISDADHIFIDGKQYVALSRFGELTQKINIELMLLQTEVETLSTENKALRVLLKEQLEKESQGE